MNDERPTDIHELCIDGDFAGLKTLLDENENVDVNLYKLFVYRSSSAKLKEKSHLFNSDSDEEDQYENDLFYFDYRSPLFSAIIHNQFSCVRLLVERGADVHRLRCD